MTIYPRRYKADLIKTTSIRMDEQLRDDAEKAASFSGLTFGQFCRQSLRRNTNLVSEIEKEVAKQNFYAASGGKCDGQ
jgi:hypothetical protein